jgi:hypothetical protein
MHAEMQTTLALIAQIQVPALVQNELFKACADVFGFICDGKDLMLTTLVPAAHLLHKHVIRPFVVDKLTKKGDGAR